MTYKFSKTQTQQIKTFILIALFYVLLPAAIALHLIPFSFRFVLLTAVAPVLFFIRPSESINNRDLGITKCNIRESIIGVIPITILLALPAVLTAAINEPRYDNSNLTIIFYIFYILISCPFQEFAYRGYLFPALDILISGKWAKIIIAAILYSFVHIIYADVYILLSTLTAGLLWNIHYDKFRNLASVTLSHAILGVLVIILGLI